jgi:hypothetical protein
MGGLWALAESAAIQTVPRHEGAPAAYWRHLIKHQLKELQFSYFKGAMVA